MSDSGDDRPGREERRNERPRERPNERPGERSGGAAQGRSSRPDSPRQDRGRPAERTSAGSGDRKPWSKDDKSAGSGERRPSSGGERRPGGSDRGQRDGEKKLWTRAGAPARGDRDAYRAEEQLTEAERLQRELRSVRPRHDDPEIPDDVKASDLDRVARNELKTLSKDNAEGVAQHLAMAARLIDDDPALAHRHALSAARRAGRIAVVRETLAITAYATGDFALALRELRTQRRISGSNDQLALMVDSERGVGRPDRALELGRSVPRESLQVGVRVAVAIAMSGARLDLDQPELALAELEIRELDASRAFSYSPALFDAYAEVLEELGRGDDARTWRDRAEAAAAALDDYDDLGADELIEITEEDLPGADQPADHASAEDTNTDDPDRDKREEKTPDVPTEN